VIVASAVKDVGAFVAAVEDVITVAADGGTSGARHVGIVARRPLPGKPPIPNILHARPPIQALPGAGGWHALRYSEGRAELPQNLVPCGSLDMNIHLSPCVSSIPPRVELTSKNDGCAITSPVSRAS